MNLSAHNTQEIRDKLKDLFPDTIITTKSLFSGYGLFINGNIFGIVKDKIFYLRAEQALEDEVKQYGYHVYQSPQKSFSAKINYFEITQVYLDNKVLMKRLIETSLQQVISAKQQTLIKKQNKLRYLPNINIKHERLLARINIFSVQDLKQVGSEYVYAELKKQGLDITLDLYWNICASLQQKNILSMDIEEKRALFNKLNVYLDQHNLKKERWPYLK